MRTAAVLLAVLALGASTALAAERCEGKFSSLNVYCSRLTADRCRTDALCRLTVANDAVGGVDADAEDALWQLRRRSLSAGAGGTGGTGACVAPTFTSSTTSLASIKAGVTTSLAFTFNKDAYVKKWTFMGQDKTSEAQTANTGSRGDKKVITISATGTGSTGPVTFELEAVDKSGATCKVTVNQATANVAVPTWDSTPPAVASNQATPVLAKKGDSQSFVVTFNEQVKVTAADVSGTGATWTVTSNPTIASGTFGTSVTLTWTVPANLGDKNNGLAWPVPFNLVVEDKTGNSLTVGPSTTGMDAAKNPQVDTGIAFSDITASVQSPPANNLYSAGDSFVLQLAFLEAVTASEVKIGGVAVSSGIVSSNSDKTVTITYVIPDTMNVGNIIWTAKITENGGTAQAITVTNSDVTISPTPEHISVVGFSLSASSPVSSSTVDLTLTFTVPTTGVVKGSIAVTAEAGGSAVSAPVVANPVASSGNKVWKFALSMTSFEASTITVTYQPNAGQSPKPKANPSNEVFSYAPPTVNIVGTQSGDIAAGTGKVKFTATFSEAVTGVALGDFQVQGGNAANFVVTSSTVYSVEVDVPKIKNYHVECLVNAGSTDAPKQNAKSNTAKVDTVCNTCLGTTEYYQHPSGKVTLTTVQPGAGTPGTWTYSVVSKPSGAADPAITDSGNTAEITAGLAPGDWGFKAVSGGGSIEQHFDIRVSEIKSFTIAPSGNSKTIAEGMQTGSDPIVLLTGGTAALTWTVTEVPSASVAEFYLCVGGSCTKVPGLASTAGAGTIQLPLVPTLTPPGKYTGELRFATPAMTNAINSLNVVHKQSAEVTVKNGFAGVTGALSTCFEDCLPGRANRTVECKPITGFTPDAAGTADPPADAYCWTVANPKPATELACTEGPLTTAGQAPNCTAFPDLFYAAPSGEVVLDSKRKDAGATNVFTITSKPSGVDDPTVVVSGGQGTIAAGLAAGVWEFQVAAAAYGVVGAYKATMKVTVMELNTIAIAADGVAATKGLNFVQGGGAKVTWASVAVPADAKITARFFDASANGKEYDTTLDLFAGANTKNSNGANGVVFSLPGRAPVGNYHVTLRVASIATVNTDTVGGTRREAAKSASFALGSGYEPSVGAFGACRSSAGCGPGVRSRTVTCVGKLDGVINPDIYCWPDVAQKPALEEACSLGACTQPFWKTGAYSACTKECGWGRATRTVECRKADDSGTAPDTECVSATNSPKPATEKVCNAFKCETYEWYTGRYGRCDLPCADGAQVSRQRRSVGCRSQQTLAARPADKCTTAKPAEFKNCEVPSCITPYWVAGEWTGCSAECGGGTSTRSMQCKKKNSVSDPTASDQADSVCVDGGVPKPLSSRVCNTSPCAVLASSPWTACDVECGGGKRTRTLKCFEYATSGSSVVATEKPLSVCENFIKPAPLPATESDCNTQRCPVLNNCDIEGICNDAGTANSCDPTKKDAVDGSDGACTCDTANWEGRYCEQSKGCNKGAILDSAGDCCDSGVVDPSTGVCCGPVAALDSNGQCCRSGKVDGCGVCDGDGAFIDPTGYCCSVDVADAGGLCCEGASRGVKGEVDGCGVCNGLDECNFKATMDIEVDANTDTETLQADYASELFKSLALPSDWQVEVTFVAIPARRALLELLRSVRALAGVKYQMIANIIPGPSSAPPPGLDAQIAESATQVQVPGLNVTSAPVVAREAVCKNGLCEVGERCTASNAATCCVDDCPYKQLQCPTTEGADEACSGHGRCDENTGTCECFTAQGYSGDDCSGCGEGFISVGGTCRYLVIRGITISRETLVKAGWAVVMGLVLCLFVGVVAFWCKENKAAAKGPAADTRSGAVELTTRRQDWV